MKIACQIGNSIALALSLVLVLGAPAAAQTPRIGGTMEHVTVTLSNQKIEVHAATAGPLILKNYGETYSGAAAVLNGTWYNAQYGWMVEGSWTPPAGSSLWIQCGLASPGLLSYRGGTYAPIFGTAGSLDRIGWSGSMLHNWYAATSPGTFAASYTVYLGDAAGVPTPGYVPGTVTLRWKTGLACAADFDGSGAVSVQDIFTFLASYFADDLSADVDQSKTVGVQDIFEFLARYFAGC